MQMGVQNQSAVLAHVILGNEIRTSGIFKSKAAVATETDLVFLFF